MTRTTFFTGEIQEISDELDALISAVLDCSESGKDKDIKAAVKIKMNIFNSFRSLHERLGPAPIRDVPGRMTYPSVPLDLETVREFYSSSIDVTEHAERVGVGNLLASACSDIQTLVAYIDLLQEEVSRLSK